MKNQLVEAFGQVESGKESGPGHDLELLVNRIYVILVVHNIPF